MSLLIWLIIKSFLLHSSRIAFLTYYNFFGSLVSKLRDFPNVNHCVIKKVCKNCFVRWWQFIPWKRIYWLGVLANTVWYFFHRVLILKRWFITVYNFSAKWPREVVSLWPIKNLETGQCGESRQVFAPNDVCISCWLRWSGMNSVVVCFCVLGFWKYCNRSVPWQFVYSVNLQLAEIN